MIMDHTDNLRERGSELDYFLGSYSEESEGEEKMKSKMLLL